MMTTTSILFVLLSRVDLTSTRPSPATTHPPPATTLPSPAISLAPSLVTSLLSLAKCTTLLHQAI